MTKYSITYEDHPGRRVLDLRPHGVDCIPVLGLSNFSMIHLGTDYHIHPGCVEICLCIRGNLAFETVDRTYPFLPNNLFVSTDREPHRMRHNPKGLIIYRILFALPKSGSRIFGLSSRETEWISRSLTHLPKRLFKSTPRVKRAFETLFSTYDTVRLRAERSVKLKTAALDLLVAVIEAARLLPPKPPVCIGAVMKAMREHPEHDYPVDQLAASVSLSPSAFSETFKLAAGLPPHAYLISCRIQKAQNLLKLGKSSCRAISELLHFSSTQHFATTFKRVTGKSPSGESRPRRDTTAFPTILPFHSHDI